MTTTERAELDAASALVHRCFGPTPQYEWPLLGAAVGARVWVKHEDATPIGAFKVRGGLVYLDRLRRQRPRVRGIVTATRGNHGQSVAFAARSVGTPVTVVVPEGNSVEKNAAMCALGARLVVHGADFQAAAEHAAALAERDGLEVVPSFHPDLVLGVASYALELLELLTGGERLDAVYVPVGMGSGICGLITVRDLLGLRTEIVGVVAEGAPAYALSFARGAPVATGRAATFVDGVACRVPDPDAVATIRAGAARVLVVGDDATAEAMRLCYRATHHLPEPAGAIALAGLWAERERQAGRSVAVVLTGANMDSGTAAAVLSGHTPPPPDQV